jgi:hypothetical protein
MFRPRSLVENEAPEGESLGQDTAGRDVEGKSDNRIIGKWNAESGIVGR